MSYLIVFIVLGILLVFHFVFYSLIKDGTNQFLILGVYAFYGACTIVKQIPCVLYALEGLKFGLSDIMFFFFMVLDIYCVVIYLMHFLDSQAFRCGAGISMALELLVLMVSVFLWCFEFACFGDFFFLSILLVGSFSLIYAIVFFILEWSTLSKYYRTIIVATFFMVIWFLILVGLNLSHSEHLAFCGVGMVCYFIVYAIISIVEINHRLNPKDEATQKKIEAEIKLTKKEQDVIAVIREKNISSTKDIVKYVEGTCGSIDTCIYRLISKYQAKSRADLVAKLIK